MSADQKQGPKQHPDAECKDPLSQRRPLDPLDEYYDVAMCPCEEQEPDPQSEYDVAGEWITYDGPINLAIFEGASSTASEDLEREMKMYLEATEPSSPPMVTDDYEDLDQLNDEWAAITAELDANSAVETAKQAGEKAREAERKAVNAKQFGGRRAKILRKAAVQAAAHANELMVVAQKAVQRAKRQARFFATTGEPISVTLTYYTHDENQSSHDGVAAAASACGKTLQAANGSNAQPTTSAVSAARSTLLDLDLYAEWQMRRMAKSMGLEKQIITMIRGYDNRSVEMWT